MPIEAAMRAGRLQMLAKVKTCGSIILACEMFVRASSYHFRPPESSSSTSSSWLIEGFIPYSDWAFMLVIGAAFILIGVRLRKSWLLTAGHMIAMILYLILALSVITAAVVNGASWSTLGWLLIGVYAHGWRIKDPLP